MRKIRPTPEALRQIQQVQTLSGESVGLCMQCGTCSASCPNVADMDRSPRAIMHLAHLGLLDELLDSQTMWTCSSCLQCAARCPRGIDLARVMEAFRALRLRLRRGRISPADIGDPALADAPPVLLISAMRKLTG